MDFELKDRLRAKGFIGQKLAVNKLSIFAEEIKAGGFMNILFIGEAGYGKTTLAKELLNYINPKKDNYQIYLPDGGLYYLNGKKKYHFLDEIHELGEFEKLYHLMEEDVFCLFFATNTYDILPQPFVDRCEHIILDRYNINELSNIIENEFIKNKVGLPKNYYKILAEYTRGVPRICKNTAKRLSFAFGQYGIPETEENLHEFMYNFYGLEKGGFTQQDILYLEYLNKVGQSSLQRIISGTGLPRKTVIEYIEPFLLKHNKIMITNKGRIIVDE